MPLLNHFRPPLSLRRRWHSFFNCWATYLSAQLNTRLPADYFAAIDVRFATPVVEVGIFAQSGGPVLAGAVELVSPSNKDRPETRAAFASKCAAYLQAGVGVVVVDVVTERTADLHAELLARLGVTPAAAAELYAAAYRPVERAGAAALDVWHEPLAVGRPLPTLPLWLRGGLCLPVDLQASYDRTCREQRVSPAA